jgi:uncharacterized protein YjiS (DUF1127 family)
MNAVQTTIGFLASRRAGRLASLWRWVRLCLARSAQRRDLAWLDDQALKDIGISRAAAASEAAKPFWRP